MTVSPSAADWPSFSATVAGHGITVIPSGPARFETLLALIDDARASLCLLFYIYQDDDSGTAVRDALIRAARRGVAVSMLLDSFGSATTPESFFAGLRSAGGTVRWFGTRWTPRYLIRNHQKLVIADGSKVMSGGFNISDDYFAPASNRQGWHDLAFTLTGPVVTSAVRWFDGLANWAASPRPRFGDLRRQVRRWNDGGSAVAWQVGGPTVRLSPWAQCLKRDMNAAQSLSFSMAYFAPNAAWLRRIGRITKRGGSVRMVLPARSDNGATVGASRLLYGFLLKRDVAIAEYEPQRLHAKLLVIDDIVLIGSANFDMRSLYVNMELMLRVRDAGFASECRAFIAEQESQSTVITPQLHRQRAGPLTRIRWFASWLMVTVIDYSVSRRLNFGLSDPE